MFENLSVNSLKGDLSKASTFNPPLFSLVNTFKLLICRSARLTRDQVDQVKQLGGDKGSFYILLCGRSARLTRDQVDQVKQLGGDKCEPIQVNIMPRR